MNKPAYACSVRMIAVCMYACVSLLEYNVFCLIHLAG